MSTNYSDQYEYYKKSGVEQPIVFLPIEKGPEYFVPITNLQVPDIMYCRYYISNYGNIFDSYINSYVNKSYDKNGYARVSIICSNGYKTCRVGRLVLLTLDYRPDHNLLQVNHIDGNHSNDTRSNLEWVTAKENSDHAMLYGLHKMNNEYNPNNKLTENQVREICELIQSGKYYDSEIAKMYNVSCTNISDIHKRKIWANISREYNFGERKPRALYNNQIHEICKLLELGKYTDAYIAEKFNTSTQTIRYIRIGKIHTDISSQYNISKQAIPKKFTKDQIKEICELIQCGKYYDTEIAKMYNTNPTFLRSLRIGQIHTDITKDYDMIVRKK